MLNIESGAPKEWKKYRSYEVSVDPLQDDKGKDLLICSFARPHMRAFHCAWWSFFIAFFMWFAISPLLPEIRQSLGLTKQEIWTSSIAGVGGTIFVRFLLGPLCDKFGARVLFALILCLGSIPTACFGLANSAEGLTILRLFIGIVGGSFVMCEYWTSQMFTLEVVGTANAMVAGWGNLGAGVTQLVVGSALFPLFTVIFDGDAEMAWRTVCIVPALVGFVTGITVYFISDDSPKGNYSELKKNGTMPNVSAISSCGRGTTNLNTWIMFIQYACCFGVELTMYNATALYFRDEFGLNTESAGAITAIFGWMNLFARALGGWVSDRANAQYGMRGRLWAQSLLLIAEGMMVLIFVKAETLGTAILVMVIFSIFVQASEGTSFAIVPYIDPQSTGTISGIVGAGGNCGAVGFGFAFRQFSYEKAFMIMGLTILGSAILSIFIVIKGQNTMLSCIRKSSVVKNSSEISAILAQQEEERQESDI